VIFFCFLFWFFGTLSNYGVLENVTAIKQCHFQNNYGAIAHAKICSCASIFKFFSVPTGFPFRGKFMLKITNFDDFEDSKPLFVML